MAYNWTDMSAGMPLPASVLNGLGNEVESLSSIVREPVFAQISLTGTAQSIASSGTTWVYVNYDTTDFESQPGMVNLTNNTITIPVSGIYQITHVWAFQGNTTGIRGGLANKNDSSTPTPQNIILYEFAEAPDLGAGPVSDSGPIPLLAGDVIRAAVIQNSGGPLTNSTIVPKLSVLLLART